MILGGGAELQELVAWLPPQMARGMGESTFGVEAGSVNGEGTTDGS